jgi:hypothetical protein
VIDSDRSVLPVSSNDDVTTGIGWDNLRVKMDSGPYWKYMFNNFPLPKSGCDRWPPGVILSRGRKLRPKPTSLKAAPRLRATGERRQVVTEHSQDHYLRQ